MKWFRKRDERITELEHEVSQWKRQARQANERATDLKNDIAIYIIYYKLNDTIVYHTPAYVAGVTRSKVAPYTNTHLKIMTTKYPYESDKVYCINRADLFFQGKFVRTIWKSETVLNIHPQDGFDFHYNMNPANFLRSLGLDDTPWEG